MGAGATQGILAIKWNVREFRALGLGFSFVIYAGAPPGLLCTCLGFSYIYIYFFGLRAKNQTTAYCGRKEVRKRFWVGFGGFRDEFFVRVASLGSGTIGLRDWGSKLSGFRD